MARQKRTHGYDARLKLALSEGPRPMSARQLADEFKRMKERKELPHDLRGTSYGGVRQYTEGRVANPRVELLQAMAQVLGVRTEWLAFDDGKMTEAQEAASRAGRAGAAAGAGSVGENLTADPERLEGAFLECLPALANASPASWHTVAELYEAIFTAPSRLSRIGAAMSAFAAQKGQESGERGEAMRALQVECAREAASLVGAAAREAGIDLTTVNRWFLDRYIQTTAQACAMLFVAPHRLQPGPLAWAATVKADGTVIPEDVIRGKGAEEGDR